MPGVWCTRGKRHRGDAPGGPDLPPCPGYFTAHINVARADSAITPLCARCCARRHIAARRASLLAAGVCQLLRPSSAPSPVLRLSLAAAAATSVSGSAATMDGTISPPWPRCTQVLCPAQRGPTTGKHEHWHRACWKRAWVERIPSFCRPEPGSWTRPWAACGRSRCSTFDL